MEPILTQFWSVVIDIIGTVLAMLVCIGVSYLISWIKTKVRNEKTIAALSELEKAVIDGVHFTEQTLVRHYKESDSWDSDAMNEALEECGDFVMSNLTAPTISWLASDEYELRNLVTQKIEAKLGEMHSNTTS